MDLGQASEFTALAVLERPAVHADAPSALRRPGYALRHLQRFPPGTPYAQVSRVVRSLLRGLPPPGGRLVVDQTGVGGAVVDLLVDGLNGQVKCSFCRVTITAGHEIANGETSSLHVPKKELVGTLQVLLQTRRLHVARALPDAAVLARELENFRAKVTLARTETVEAWREGQHDDLVLAAALAAWVGEKALPPLFDPYHGGATRLVPI